MGKHRVLPLVTVEVEKHFSIRLIFYIQVNKSLFLKFVISSFQLACMFLGTLFFSHTYFTRFTHSIFKQNETSTSKKRENAFFSPFL